MNSDHGKNKHNTGNVSIRSVRALGNKYFIFWVCICSLRYPASHAHAPYCHLWPAKHHDIFLHYLINSTIFGKKKKKLNEYKMCVLSSSKVSSETSHSQKIWQRCDNKCTLVFTESSLLVILLRFLIKPKFSRKIFEKYLAIRFHENPSSGNQAVPFGRTDGHTDMRKLIVAFRKFSNAPKNV